jgi:2-dehydro-3-deoxyglucarate aldolase
MNRLNKILEIRNKLNSGDITIGSWMQIPNSSIAEIMGQSNYDWVAIDMEHGAISLHQLPDIFRALELGNTLPLVRLARGHYVDCKHALDAGAGGVIVPMIETADQLIKVRNATRWPPSGNRGVAFSRANLFGKHFDDYINEASQPLLVAMIESKNSVNNLDDILKVEGLDAILIGPYDLSSSMNLTAQFNHSEFVEVIGNIQSQSEAANIPCGVHVVSPDIGELQDKVDKGYRFIPYSIDSVFLNHSVSRPNITKKS